MIYEQVALWNYACVDMLAPMGKPCLRKHKHGTQPCRQGQALVPAQEKQGNHGGGAPTRSLDSCL